MMRFPGDPISRQDRFHAEQEERERVLRLIREEKQGVELLLRGTSSQAEDDRQENEAIVEVLDELETAVRQGLQRLDRRRRR